MASGRAFSEVTGKDRSDFVEYPDGLHERCIPYICDKHRATLLHIPQFTHFVTPVHNRRSCGPLTGRFPPRPNALRD